MLSIWYYFKIAIPSKMVWYHILGYDIIKSRKIRYNIKISYTGG